MNLCVFLLCFGAMLPNKEEKKEPVDYVNPFIGTKSMGHTFPGACVPYGAVCHIILMGFISRMRIVIVLVFSMTIRRSWGLVIRI